MNLNTNWQCQKHNNHCKSEILTHTTRTKEARAVAWCMPEFPICSCCRAFGVTNFQSDWLAHVLLHLSRINFEPSLHSQMAQKCLRMDHFILELLTHLQAVWPWSHCWQQECGADCAHAMERTQLVALSMKLAVHLSACGQHRWWNDKWEPNKQTAQLGSAGQAEEAPDDGCARQRICWSELVDPWKRGE